MPSTKAQRARVILALDCLACQAGEHYLIEDVLDEIDLSLAERAWMHPQAWRIDHSAWKTGDVDWWRYHAAEAAQLVREGRVR